MTQDTFEKAMKKTFPLIEFTHFYDKKTQRGLLFCASEKGRY